MFSLDVDRCLSANEMDPFLYPTIGTSAMLQEQVRGDRGNEKRQLPKSSVMVFKQHLILRASLLRLRHGRQRWIKVEVGMP